MIKLTETVRSAIEVEVFGAPDEERDPETYEDLRRAIAYGKASGRVAWFLRVPGVAEPQRRLVAALVAVSDSYDAVVYDRFRDVERSERIFARRAIKHLEALIERVRAIPTEEDRPKKKSTKPV